jgi:hypothetical protein
VIVLTGASELYRYFVVWARSEQVQQAYQALQLQASEELRSLPPSQQVLIGVEEPTDYDWRQHASVHVNPDGSSALLALQSQIPLFIAGQRPHTYYVSSRDLVMIDLHSKFGCDEEKLPSQSTFAANVLTSVPGCKGSLTFLRLTGAN